MYVYSLDVIVVGDYGKSATGGPGVTLNVETFATAAPVA